MFFYESVIAIKEYPNVYFANFQAVRQNIIQLKKEYQHSFINTVFVFFAA